MTKEFVFTVDAGVATEAAPVTLEEAGLRERQHLQEWVIAHPQILGTDVRVVTFEFGTWVDASGARQADRLDVLGIDASGQLVIAELKRGFAPDTVEMQAIKYAAMASRFDVQALAEQHARFLSSRAGRPVDEDEALEALERHAPELSDESLRVPRIVIVAGGFSPIVTAASVFLSESGVDISLVQFQGYRTKAGEVLISVSQLFPLPDLEELTIVPSRAEQRRRASERKRETSGVHRLVAAGALQDGTHLVFESQVQSGPVAEALRDWVSGDPSRGRAVWQNDLSRPLVWEADGQTYSPTGLVLHIIESATGTRPRARRGPNWWLDASGRSLTELAEAVAAENQGHE